MKFSSLERLDKEKLLLKTALLSGEKKHEAGKQMGCIRDVVYARVRNFSQRNHAQKKDLAYVTSPDC